MIFDCGQYLSDCCAFVPVENKSGMFFSGSWCTNWTSVNSWTLIWYPLSLCCQHQHCVCGCQRLCWNTVMCVVYFLLKYCFMFHTCQFIISCITIHYFFSLRLQTQNSSFPQIFSSVVLLLFHPPDWLYGLQLFFVFLGHVGFNLGIVNTFI